MQQGALPDPGGPHHRHELPGGDAQADPLEDLDAIPVAREALPHVLNHDRYAHVAIADCAMRIAEWHTRSGTFTRCSFHIPHSFHSYRLATTGSTRAAWRDGMIVARKLMTKAVMVMAITSGRRTRDGSLSS